MKTFVEYLIEAAVGAGADRDGKIHELLTGWHLNHHIHGQGAHMAHFRDESGLTPEQALHKHTAGMSHAELSHHNEKAAKAAKAIHEHIKEHHPEILKLNKTKKETNRVTWTSQPKDIANLTGKEDKAQQAGGADVMVTKHNRFGHVEHDHHAYGASLKFMGKKSKVGQANRGMASVEKQLGMPHKSLSQHDDDHDARTTALLGEKTAKGKHKKYKEIRDNPKPTPAQKALKDKVNESSNHRSIQQAKAIHDHLHKMSPDERRHHLTNLLAPEHTHPTYQIRTNHDDDKPTHIEDTHASVKKSLEGEHHVVHTGRYVHVKEGTPSKPGKTLASIESRSKGRPAGGGAQICPTFTKGMSHD
jgi:hypothetical protein